MDDTWKKLMDENIGEYILNTDFKSPDFSINEFKAGLVNIIGMRPAVKMKWNTTEKVNELLKQSGLDAKDYTEIVEKIDEIEITFVDADNKPLKYKYML